MFRYLFIFTILSSSFCTYTSFAEQKVIFAVGEWTPYVSETLESYGPTAEIITIACKKSGYKPQFDFYPWKRAYEIVKGGKVVATFPWIWTEKRSTEVLYPKTPIMVTKEKIFYLKEKYPKGLKIKNFKELKPYTFVGVISYWYEQPAKKAGVDIHMVSTPLIAWKMLSKKRADVFISNELVANSDMKKFFGTSMNQFASTEEPFKTAKMFCIFSKIQPDANKIMNKLEIAIKEMNESGEIKRILASH